MKHSKGTLAVIVMLLCVPPDGRGDMALTPVEDSYVSNYHSGGIDQRNTNYGTLSSVETNNAGGVRAIFLKFNLRGITAPITNLALVLTTKAGNPGEAFHIYGLTGGESWTEAGIRWWNAPGIVATCPTLSAGTGAFLRTSQLYGAGKVLGRLLPPRPARWRASGRVPVRCSRSSLPMRTRSSPS